MVPDLESGNMLAKQLEYLGGAVGGNRAWSEGAGDSNQPGGLGSDEVDIVCRSGTAALREQPDGRETSRLSGPIASLAGSAARAADYWRATL